MIKGHPLSNSLPQAGERTVTNSLSCPAGEGRGEGDWRQNRRQASLKAKSLRQNQTDAETKFWHAVKAKRFNGYKFRRQFPIGPYYVDFACIEEKLIVEIDGGQHCENKQDLKRTLFLEKEGWTVIRFWNNEVLENMEGVLQSVSLTLSRRERECSSNGDLQ